LQTVGKLISSTIQLPVRESLFFENDGQRVGSLPDLILKKMMSTPFLWRFARGLIPGHCEALRFLGRK
jgi:hypothetical protein